MIDNLLDNLKGGAIGDLMEKFGLDEKQADEVVKAAGSSTKNVMSKEVEGGAIDSVMKFFSNKPNGDKENGMLDNLTGDFVGNITRKLGIDKDKAMDIAKNFLPQLTGMITKKNEETPDTDSSSIMSMFGGKTMDNIKDTVTDKLKGLF
jgi:hypothetical protein